MSILLLALGCSSSGIEPPPGGWANAAPTVVERALDHGQHQVLQVRQGELRTWIQVPDVDAVPGDYILLGQGTARRDVALPGVDERADVVVDIPHARVVDAATAERTVSSAVPVGAVPIGTVYAELDARADKEIVVYGTVVKATSAIGSVWVHLQDGTGTSGTDDLTLKTDAMVAVGARIGFRGILRKDVDLGFGYTYEALVEDARPLR